MWSHISNLAEIPLCLVTLIYNMFLIIQMLVHYNTKDLNQVCLSNLYIFKVDFIRCTLSQLPWVTKLDVLCFRDINSLDDLHPSSFFLWIEMTPVPHYYVPLLLLNCIKGIAGPMIICIST